MKKIISLILIAFIIAIVLYLYPQFEWYKPEIKIDLESEYIGVNPFDIVITDSGKGLSSVIVILTSEDDDHILVDKNYPDGVNRDLITLKLDSNNFKMKDGPAKIIVKVEDKSRLKLFSGNKNEISKDIIIDLTPPNLELVTDQLNISQGGAGLIIYKINEDSVKSGVEVGDYYFKGYGGYFKDPNLYLSFIAYPYNIGTDEKISLLAKDKAGNIRRLGIYYILKNIDYKKSDIKVSERFILNTMAQLSNIQNNGKYKEMFLDVNRNLRNDNDKKISEITKQTDENMLWEEEFSQLSNSKVESNFADHRTYYFNEEPIDQQYHLGYDLAVTKHYPIEAGNSGIVLFADNLGIYGNTVIIDHGMGISTLYAHMSSVDVKVGDKISKKQIIGRTGRTGLAAGDHLHFGVYIQGIPVRPIEWWDGKWIKDNIMKKINNVKITDQFGTKS